MACKTASEDPAPASCGYLDHRLIARMLFTSMGNTEVFNQWLEHMLLPELHCGSVIVLDNANFHKSGCTRQLVEQVGCQLPTSLPLALQPRSQSH